MPRDLKTAQAELAEAEAALVALQERVREGDAEVTPEQLATQRELISFAELRVEAAQRTTARMREDERASLAATSKAVAEELLTGDSMSDIATAAKTAADAVASLAALVNARNAAIAEIGSVLVDIDNDLVANAGAKGAWASKRYGLWGDRNSVVVPGTGRADRLEAGRVAALAVFAGLGTDAAGLRAQNELVGSVHGLRNTVIRGLLEKYPQLAEVFRVSPEEFTAADTRGRYELTEQGRRPLPEAVEG